MNIALPVRAPRVLAAAVGVAALAMGLAPAQAAPSLSFQTPVELQGARGGEPSIATDGKGNVYVSGPQGIPSGRHQIPGVGFWVSHDHGATYSDAIRLGSYIGGGDSDVQVAPDDGTVGILDLEAVASAVCFSHDKGVSFRAASPVPDATSCTKLPSGQAGPSADREWLTLDKGGRAYVTYHEFVSAQPVIFRTDNLGTQDAFTAGPCGSIVTDPAIEANVPQDVTGGTLISKPVLDSQGNLYILFTSTTQQQNAANLPGSVSGTFSQIYLAVSKNGCQSFTDYTVFDGSKLGTNTVQFGDIFNDIAIDGAGNLYIIGAGYIGDAAPSPQTADIFLFTSTDGGQTWAGPRKVTGDHGAHMMPAAVGGPLAGQLAIGYFRTTNGITDPNSADGTWTYTVAESTNALNPATAGFAYGDMQSGRTFHAGDICTSGILCNTGLPGTGNDRSLADFTQATVDSDGCPIFTFAGNPDPTKGTFNYVSKQRTGCFATAAAVSPGSVPATSPAATNTGAATQAATVGTPNTTGASTNRGAVIAAGAALLGVALLARRRRRRTSTRD
jgi:MYXO-CTERM domain-containing protein